MTVDTAEASRLPFELERDIFELAARSSPTCIPGLIMVAQRVKTWLEPILYNVLVLSDRPGNLHLSWTTLCFLADSKPLSFWGSTVNHLLISSRYPADIPGILAACGGVTDLGLRHPEVSPACLPALSVLPLTRFFAELRPLFARAVDFQHPLFRGLTHLGIADFLTDADCAAWTEGLASLPALTHVSFHNRHHTPLFQALLSRCTGLEALVLCCATTQYFDLFKARTAWMGYDVRAVMILVPSSCADWVCGARGGEDHWVRSERWIRWRREGGVRADAYIVE
ncbi:hypothetical protein FB45DRAFT_1008068 [Roridomyces roridus]|uniref:Uncharacterized protein n=1 Tax=Roridomyces roridus TaxID=1738132 RepID=A0AAD7BBU6_9AGAR|nr:hypothetical protein FB45DRAFT_1008068 [Roridomyces roridus]